MIKLSYSTLNYLHNGHEYLNKQMGIPVPPYPFLKEGKEAHRIIQEHVSGKKAHPSLFRIETRFPVVEEKEFDERCKFSFRFDDEVEIFGFVDGLDFDNKRFLEIKTSSEPWSMTKFRDAMQRKLYSLCLPEYKEAYLITGSKDPQKWQQEPPRIYSMQISDQDRNEAMRWVKKGLEIFHSGDFTGGLDANHKCNGCFWNMSRYPELASCHFL